MAQQRIFNFGDTATQEKIKTIFSKLLPALRYEGYNLTIGGVSSITINPGTLLLPNGVVVVEDTSLTIPVPITGLVEDFTIVCTHNDETIIGGVGASYHAISGFFNSYLNSTILGWVRYPGGGIPLDASMIIPSPMGPFQEFLSIANDYSSKVFLSPLASLKTLSDSTWITSTATYSAIPIPNTREEIAILMGSPGAQTATHYFSVLAKSIPPVAIRFRHNTPITLGTDITVRVYDTLGNLVTSTPVIGTGSWEVSTVTLDIATFTFTEGETFSVQFVVEGSGGDTILLEWVEVIFNPTP